MRLCLFSFARGTNKSIFIECWFLQKKNYVKHIIEQKVLLIKEKKLDCESACFLGSITYLFVHRPQPNIIDTS